MKLICFPFAGGNSFSYRNMLATLPVDITVTVLEYPGRGARISEPLTQNLNMLADLLFNEIKAEHDLGQTYAFYGHSMGALLALLVARRIQNADMPLPKFLFVSGKSAPSLSESNKHYLLSSSDFWVLLNNMGGMPQGVSENVALCDFFEPIIRADMQALGTWRYEESPPLSCPITVWIGQDEGITISAASGWQQETTDAFHIEYFEGKHFFIFDHSVALCTRLNEQFINDNIVTAQY